MSSASVGWLQFESVCDDTRNTVLMMPPLLSHYSIDEDRERDEKVGKYCGGGLLGYRDDEVHESELCVGGEGRGELVVLLVKFVWIMACVKTRLPDHLDQQKCKPKKNGQIW